MTSSTTVAPETTEVEAPTENWKGQNVPRKEDRRLVQGQGVFVDDVKRHGMGYIHFVRSPYALSVTGCERSTPSLSAAAPAPPRPPPPPRPPAPPAPKRTTRN